MGEKLGTGLNLDQALREMIMVAEGVRAARMFQRRAEDDDLKMPFVRAVTTMLDGAIDAEECCRRIASL